MILARDASAVTDGIANLVAKSLVALDQIRDGNPLALLETTRAYALEKLAESGETKAGGAATRGILFGAVHSVRNRGQRQARFDDLGLYRREIDNLRAALNWAFLRRRRWRLGVALAAADADFWVAASLIAGGL